MASFITANETLSAALNGSISRSMPTIIGRKLDEAAGVNAGRVLAPSGTDNLECQEPTTEAMVKAAYGFSVWTPMEEDADLTDGSPHYADNQMVSIMTKGSMWVDCEGTVVAGAPVFVRVTSDGGSNTELGKVRGDSDVVSGGVVITPEASLVQAISHIAVVLSDGNVTETFIFQTDASPTPTEVATGLVALIDASDKFAATGTTEINVTSGTGIVEVVSLNEQLDITTAARAFRLPGAKFSTSRTGAGLVEINFDRDGGI